MRTDKQCEDQLRYNMEDKLGLSRYANQTKGELADTLVRASLDPRLPAERWLGPGWLETCCCGRK